MRLMQSIFIARDFSLQIYGKCFYSSEMFRSTMKNLADPLSTIEERKCTPLNSRDVTSKENNS